MDNRRQRRRRLCQHCNVGKVCRPRGLCWSCFYKPAIRSQYEPENKRHGSREVEDKNGGYELPAGAMAAIGSAAKLAILQERARAGVGLWSPDDRSPLDTEDAPDE